MADATTAQRGLRKSRTGKVINRSGDKTIVVLVETRKRHPLYGKVMRQHAKVHVHDEANQAAAGDVVRIVECRPMSKQKRWRLAAVTAAALPSKGQ